VKQYLIVLNEILDDYEFMGGSGTSTMNTGGSTPKTDPAPGSNFDRGVGGTGVYAQPKGTGMAMATGSSMGAGATSYRGGMTNMPNSSGLGVAKKNNPISSPVAGGMKPVSKL
jgi:hypothetical protein